MLNLCTAGMRALLMLDVLVGGKKSIWHIGQNLEMFFMKWAMQLVLSMSSAVLIEITL